MEEFLRSRGIEEHLLEEMKSDKVDECCIEIMSDEELKKYLPTYGDRLAVRSYVGKMTSKRTSFDRKQSLLEQLKTKLDQRKSNKDTNTNACGSVNPHLATNAVKNVKKVSVGLMNFDFAQQCYRQVRTKSGGGTRTLTMPKSAKKANLMQESLKVFFPNNMSPRFGNMDAYTFDVMDYQCVSLNENLTIQHITDVTKLPNLRFYLSMKKECDLYRIEDILSNNEQSSHENTSNSTHEIQSINKPSSPENTSNSTHEIQSINEQSSPENTSNSTHEIQSIDEQSSPENTSNSTHEIQCIDEQSSPENTSNSTHEIQSINEPISVATDFEFNHTFDKSNEVCEKQLGFKQHYIKLHRGHVFNEIRCIFASNYDFQFDMFTFEIILPNGEKEMAEDNGGVLRDVLSEFWNSFYDQCTLGREFKVPFLRHDLKEADWKAIARVLYYGWKEQRYFPINLSKAFMSCCIYGMDTFASSHDSLIQEFMSFLPLSESKTMAAALEGYFDEDDLLEILGEHECRVTPTSENLSRILGEIAHKELIQQPMYVKECWFNELSFLGFDLGPSTLMSLYEKLVPSSRKVGKILGFPEVMTPVQTSTANFLKKFVRELETSILPKFLRFCTGSDVLLFDGENNYLPIAVRFTSVTGLGRCPVAHTCGRVLELPEYYENYLEFRSEFLSVLRSDIWVMDFV